MIVRNVALHIGSSLFLLLLRPNICIHLCFDEGKQILRMAFIIRRGQRDVQDREKKKRRGGRSLWNDLLCFPSINRHSYIILLWYWVIAEGSGRLSGGRPVDYNLTGRPMWYASKQLHEATRLSPFRSNCGSSGRHGRRCAGPLQDDNYPIIITLVSRFTRNGGGIDSSSYIQYCVDSGFQKATECEDRRDREGYFRERALKS